MTTPATSGTSSATPGTPAAAPIRALIVDDEALSRQRVRRLLRAERDVSVVGECADGAAAVEAIARLAPDVVFLDVQMPELDGFGVLRQLADQRAESDERTAGGGAGARQPLVVFVTAYDQYALEAFEREAVDYLVKPVSDERLAKCVERLKRRLDTAAPAPGMAEVLERIARALPQGAGSGRLRWVRALKGDVVQQIPVDEVLYFQAQDKYTCVMTRAAEYLIRTPLAEVAAQLDAEVFWQIHRGTVVNMDEVASTRRDLAGRVFVRLKDGRTELTVSRAYAQKFRHM